MKIVVIIYWIFLVPSDSNSESSEASDVEVYPGTHDSRMRFQKRTFSLKKRAPIPATVSLPPELHNTHNLNIQLNSSELFPSKLNSYGNVHDDESSLDVSSPRDNNSPMVFNAVYFSGFCFNCSLCSLVRCSAEAERSRS